MIWPRAQTILTSRRSRSRPVHGRLVSGVGKRQRRSGSLVIDVTVRSNLASPSRSCDADNWCTACQRQRQRDRRICKTQPARTPTRCRPTRRSQAGVRAGWLCRFAAGLSPASSTGASARLYELFGRLKSVGKFLVLNLLLQVLDGIILLLRRQSILRASRTINTIHDRSPLGSSLPMRRASPSRAERPQGSLAATGKK